MAASRQTNGQKTLQTLWRERIFKRDFEIVLGKMLQSDQGREDETEESYLRSANVQWEGVDLSDVKTMWFSSAEKRDLLLREGDLVVNEGGDVGRCAIWRGIPESFYFQNAINRVRARTSASTRFLYYWLYNLKHAGFIDAMVSRITIAHLTAEKLARVPWPDVPSAEQQRIAAYLDASCAAIDAAVAAKRRQLETLDALRKSITLQAITKGLDPNVPMRETGIDWIPQIPAHWETTKLTSLFWFRKGARAGEITQKYIAEYPGEFPVYSGQTEDGGLMGSIDSFEFDFDSPVIFVTTVGAKAMSTRLVRGKFSISQNCALIIPWHRKTRVDYFEPTIQELFDFERRSIALIMQPSLRFKDLKKFRLPLPPLTEQAVICARLDAKLGQAKRIASGIENQIATLTAYRKSLIHECVTGQRRVTDKDVRHAGCAGSIRLVEDMP